MAEPGKPRATLAIAQATRLIALHAHETIELATDVAAPADQYTASVEAGYPD